MRILVSVFVTLGVGLAMYLMFLKATGSHAGGKGGGSPLRAISTTTVKAQLINIAEAERIWFAQNSGYATMDELTSSGAIKFKNPDPTGYTYSVETSPTGFVATARRDKSRGGPSADYPTMTIDDKMTVQDDDSQPAGNDASAGPQTAGNSQPESASDTKGDPGTKIDSQAK